MANHLSVLIIDDEADQLLSLKSFLKRRGHEVFTADNGPDGLAIATRETIDLVLSDFRMPDWDGLTVLERIKTLNPDIDVVIITAFGNLDDAVRLMKAGAYDYLSKPVDLEDLERLVARVAERRHLVRENRHLKARLQEGAQLEAILSRSSAMADALSAAARVAPSKATVLVRGESGTGKELLAMGIHHASERRDGPFVVVNIAALPETLMESELFGHEKGAFTGASQRRIGRFEEAAGGTLFIDEVGDIPLPVQVKLLRAIQFGQIQRLGANTPVATDVRIIAATHRNLEAMIREGNFREDLYFRLNVVSIWVPPLRRRKSDIPLLANHFLERFAERNGKRVTGFSREALDQLMKYPYPGNVRELENLIEHAVVMCRGERIERSDLPAPMLEPDGGSGLFDPADLEAGYRDKLHAFEQAMIEEALQRSAGNRSAAARLLGITERHLRSRLEKLGLK